MEMKECELFKHLILHSVNSAVSGDYYLCMDIGVILEFQK